MVFFRRKKEDSPPLQPPKKAQPFQHERVLTAEGWRRLKEGKKAK